MSFHAYAAAAPGKNLEPFEYEPEPLGPSHVEVAVTHCGICHTDLPHVFEIFAGRSWRFDVLELILLNF